MSKAKTMTTEKSVIHPLDPEVEVITPAIKEGPVDLTKTVKVRTTDKAPYHQANEEIDVAPAIADLMKANGWAK